MTTTKDAIELVRELRGTVCRCGAAKKSRHTFCNRCYYTLPPRERRDLYQQLGDGYEEAYAAAVAILDRSTSPAA